MTINQFYINQVPFNSGQPQLPEVFDGVHTSRVKSRLIAQFKDKQNIQALVEVFMSELDELEEAINEVLVYREIDLAFGQQLDLIGDIVGRRRDGYDDVDYRSRLKLQIGINTSEGEANKILQVWKTLTGSTLVSLTEDFPAGLTLTAETSTVDTTILQEMNRLSAAGVNMNLLVSSGTPFGFFDSAGAGFGTTDDPLLGGSFVSIAS